MNITSTALHERKSCNILCDSNVAFKICSTPYVCQKEDEWTSVKVVSLHQKKEILSKVKDQMEHF